MNCKRFAMVLACCLLWPVAASAADKETLIMLDKTDSTDDWIINTDLSATGNIAIVDGPKEGMKAVRFNYDISGGKWSNLGKEYRKNIDRAQALVFWFKGEGLFTLEIKMSDMSGTTYGIKIPGATQVPEWRKMVVPIENMTYLWGGTSKVLDLKNIRGIDFAAASEQGGPGYFMLSQLQYSVGRLAADLPAPVQLAAPQAAGGAAPAAAAPPSKGRLDIGMESLWRSFPDKGASVKMSLVEGPTKDERAIQAAFTWGGRKIPGVQEETGNWVAFNREINMDLSEMRNIVFMCKSSGAVANLEVKLIDKDGSVYGKIYPSGSSLYSWSSFVVPRSDLNYMWGGDGTGKFDWLNVARIEFALSRTNDSRDTGTFAAADIRFESAVITPRGVEPKAEETPAVTGPGRVRVMIDDFTDLNPSNRYYVITGDDSTLVLSSSRITFDADYSMQMVYTLQTNRPTGSWVEAQRRFSPPLNWTGVEEVKVWVRGDASQNLFRIMLMDEQDTLWVADNDRVLASKDWSLVSIPVEAFTTYSESNGGAASGRRLKDHLSSIKQLSIAVLNPPNKTGATHGELYIENLYVVGRGINTSRAVPAAPKVPVGLSFPLKNWNIGGTSETFLNVLPNTGSVLTQNAALKITGNFEKFSVLSEIRLDSTFGSDADTFRSSDATLVGPNLAVTLLNPVDGVSDVILGNLYINASPNILANDNLYGGWGFKGMLVEGWLGKFNHHTYYLKHAPESYSLAGQYILNLDEVTLNLIGTYYNDQPFIQNATRLESDDKAVLLDANRKFTWAKVLDLNVRLQAGYDWFQKYFDTSTQEAIDQRLNGGLFQGEASFSELGNLLWPGLSITGQYNYADPNYKPTFRQSPGFWDVEYGDQKGFGGRLYQLVAKNYFASADYQKIDRLSNDRQYRERTRMAIGYNNWDSLDATLSQEFVTKVYNFTDQRFLVDGLPAVLFENWRESNTEIYIAYHLSGNLTISEKVQYKQIERLDITDHYSEMYAFTKVEYFPTPNIKFSLENKFSRFGRTVDVPVINPADIFSFYDYTWVKVNLIF